MRCRSSAVVAVLFCAHSAHAQEAGLINWSVEVNAEETIRLNDGKDRQEYSAHISAVVQGRPFEYGMAHLNVGTGGGGPGTNVTQLSVGGSGKETISADGGSTDLSGAAVKNETSLGFDWNEPAHTMSFGVSVGYSMNGTSKSKCRDTPDGPEHSCTQEVKDPAAA